MKKDLTIEEIQKREEQKLVTQKEKTNFFISKLTASARKANGTEKERLLKLIELHKRTQEDLNKKDLAAYVDSLYSKRKEMVDRLAFKKANK